MSFTSYYRDEGFWFINIAPQASGDSFNRVVPTRRNAHYTTMF